jgi:hypothetical protein
VDEEEDEEDEQRRRGTGRRKTRSESVSNTFLNFCRRKKSIRDNFVTLLSSLGKTSSSRVTPPEFRRSAAHSRRATSCIFCQCLLCSVGHLHRMLIGNHPAELSSFKIRERKQPNVINYNSNFRPRSVADSLRNIISPGVPRACSPSSPSHQLVKLLPRLGLVGIAPLSLRTQVLVPEPERQFRIAHPQSPVKAELRERPCPHKELRIECPD